MRLSRRVEPFASDQHIFELKIDGFRALAFVESGTGELVSNTFDGFVELASGLLNTSVFRVPYSMARLHVSTMQADRSFVICSRECHCVYIAFDLLHLNGKDLRTLPATRFGARVSTGQSSWL